MTWRNWQRTWDRGTFGNRRVRRLLGNSTDAGLVDVPLHADESLFTPVPPNQCRTLVVSNGHAHIRETANETALEEYQVGPQLQQRTKNTPPRKTRLPIGISVTVQPA